MVSDLVVKIGTTAAQPVDAMPRQWTATSAPAIRNLRNTLTNDMIAPRDVTNSDGSRMACQRAFCAELPSLSIIVPECHVMLD